MGEIRKGGRAISARALVAEISRRFRAPQMADRATARFQGPRAISLIARGTPPLARAIALWEIPSGVRYSASRISPGEMGGLIAGVYFAFALAGSLAVTSGNFLMSSLSKVFTSQWWWRAKAQSRASPKSAFLERYH